MNVAPIDILSDPRVDQATWAYHNLTETDLEHSPRTNPRTVSASANVNPLDDLILVTATATLTLESPVGCDGRKHIFALTAAATMTLASSANIDGAATLATSTQYSVVCLESTGVTWKVLWNTSAYAIIGAITTSGLTMSTARLLGRTTAAAGAVEEITVGNGLNLAAGALTATGTGAQDAASADQSVTSSTTLVNATSLAFAIGASEEWCAEVWIDAGAAINVTGFLCAVTVPSGATLNLCGHAAALDPSAPQRTTTSGGNLNFSAALFPNTLSALIHLSIWVLNSTNAGTVQVQFAQSTNSGTATTIRKGSHIVANKIA